MASRKSVVFTKCSFSFTLERQRGIGGGPCPLPPTDTTALGPGCGPCPPQSVVNSHPGSLGTVQRGHLWPLSTASSWSLSSCGCPAGPCGHYAVLVATPCSAPRATRTWQGRGCSQQGPWSLSHSPPCPHKPSPASVQTWGRQHRVSSSSRGPATTATQAAPGRDPGPGTPSPPAHLMRSGLLSSLPRCSRPRVQAKMLAMGLVLVGHPCTGRVVSPGVVSPGVDSLAQAADGLCSPAQHTHLLVLPVVAGDGAMGSLGLNGLPVRTHQDRGHQPQGAEAYGGTGVRTAPRGDDGQSSTPYPAPPWARMSDWTSPS